MTIPKKFDTIVIGGGLMGSSAAWHLSNAGERLLMIEKQADIYSQGSSFGQARITRSLGPKDDIFSWLHNRSVTESMKLAAYLEGHYKNENQVMDNIYTTSPVTYLYYRSQNETVDALINGQADTIQISRSADEASNKFGLVVPDDAIVIREYKKNSGTLNPAVLISKLHYAVKANGSSILLNHQVITINRTNQHFEITLKNNENGAVHTYTAKKIVSAAGPYTGELLKPFSPAIDKLITPKQVYLSFFSIKKEIWHRLAPEQQTRLTDFYPMIDMNPDFVFSMIEKRDADGVPVIKTGGHMRRYPIDNLDQVWGKEPPGDEIEWAHQTTSRYLEMLNMPITYDDLLLTNSYSCVYSMTESEIPIVTEVPGIDNNTIPGLVVMGGMSGIGAKGSLAYGLIAANLLLNQPENEPMYNKTVNALRLKI